MSLLFRSRQPEARSVRIPAEYLYRGTGGSGVYVDSESAMRHDAVWGCITRISQDLAQLPPDVFYREGGTKREIDPVPQIIAAPSLNAKPLDWRYQVIASWLSAGRVWGLVTQTDSTYQFAQRIELVPESSVRVDSFGSRPRFYVDNVEHELWPVGDLWHEPAYTMPGHPLGMSPIGYHAATSGMGLTAAKFGYDTLADGGHPSALLQPEGLLDEKQAGALKERFMQLTRGNREPIVLPSTTKYTPIQISPEESQFLNSMKYSSEQIIARVYLEDPADYGLSSTGSITYANRVDADLARFKRRQFWVTKLQTALADLLPPRQFVKLNTSSALMMTPRERHVVHALRLKSETSTVNEVRDIEDEPRFDNPKFDLPGIPDLLIKSDAAKGTTP